MYVFLAVCTMMTYPHLLCTHQTGMLPISVLTISELETLPLFLTNCQWLDVYLLKSSFSQVYAAEVSSSKYRGIFGSFTQLFLSIGLVLIYFLGSFPGFQYFDASLILIGIIAVFEIGGLFICDTPRWLLAHGRRNEAISALKHLRGKDFDIGYELLMMELDLSRSPHLKMSKVLTHFTKRDVVIPLIIMLFIMFFQQIGGLNASTAYSGLIFKEAGVKYYRATATYAVGGTEVVFTIISLFIVDFFGRKSLLIISGVGMLLGTVLLGTHFFITRPSLCTSPTNSSTFVLRSDLNSDESCNAHFAPLAIVSLILFNAAFSIGWGPVPWVLLGELIPLRVRGVGSGIATLVNWSTAAIVTGFYLDYAENVKPWFAWWTFSVLNLLAVLFVVFFVFETKGKTLEEIHDRYKKQTRKINHSHP